VWILTLVDATDFYPASGPSSCSASSSLPCIEDLVNPAGSAFFLETSSFPGDASDCPRQYAWDDLRTCHVDPNIQNGEPIGGSHGSCRYRTGGSPFDDCDSYIVLTLTDNTTGLPVLGTTTPNWSCQGIAYNATVTEPSTSAGASDGTSTYFCSCNLNMLVCPNGGTCLALCDNANDHRITTQQFLGGGNPAN
jgi:hypothetical protein